MADSLPSINFGFEDLRDRMAQFTAKFDAFIERGRKQVLEERNQFHINLAELQGTVSRRMFPWPSTDLNPQRMNGCDSETSKFST